MVGFCPKNKAQDKQIVECTFRTLASVNSRARPREDFKRERKMKKVSKILDNGCAFITCQEIKVFSSF